MENHDSRDQEPRERGAVSMAFKETIEITENLEKESKYLEEYLAPVVRNQKVSSKLNKEEDKPVMSLLASEMGDVNRRLSNVLDSLNSLRNRLDL